MKYKIQVLKKRKYWYWRILRVGRILCHSEGYSSGMKARQTAEELFDNFKHMSAEYEVLWKKK